MEVDGTFVVFDRSIDASFFCLCVFMCATLSGRSFLERCIIISHLYYIFNDYSIDTYY